MSLSRFRAPLFRLLVVKLCLAVLAWANWASIEHSTDFEPHHHHHHQCELYAAISHALQSSTEALPLIDTDEAIIPSQLVQSTVRVTTPFCARDPPHYV